MIALTVPDTGASFPWTVWNVKAGRHETLYREETILYKELVLHSRIAAGGFHGTKELT